MPQKRARQHWRQHGRLRTGPPCLVVRARRHDKKPQARTSLAAAAEQQKPRRRGRAGLRPDESIPVKGCARGCGRTVYQARRGNGSVVSHSPLNSAKTSYTLNDRFRWHLGPRHRCKASRARDTSWQAESPTTPQRQVPSPGRRLSVGILRPRG